MVRLRDSWRFSLSASPIPENPLPAPSAGVRMRSSCDPAHHEADHRQLNKGEMGARERLEVLSQTTAAPQPTERAFDNPTLLEHHKALRGIRALHDLKPGPRRPANRPSRLPALVGPIRDHSLQKRKEPPHRLQNTQAAITILHVARQNGAAEH